MHITIHSHGFCFKWMFFRVKPPNYFLYCVPFLKPQLLSYIEQCCQSLPSSQLRSYQNWQSVQIPVSVHLPSKTPQASNSPEGCCLLFETMNKIKEPSNATNFTKLNWVAEVFSCIFMTVLLCIVSNSFCLTSVF